MDLRPRMYAISLGQKEVAKNDPLVQYVPTSHIGVEIGGGVGLHYHYGTLGQLEHGVNYADAYLRRIGLREPESRPLKKWPYASGAKVTLYVLAGHRNMEGERAFVQDLSKLDGSASLLTDDHTVAYKYSLGGGVKTSQGWEPLGPAGYYETFGPELSFAKTLRDRGVENLAIAKFTHSGSQIIDWTPEGSVAKSRNLYPAWISFIKKTVDELQQRGHEVELAGIIYHIGENDMSWGPFRKGAAERVAKLIEQTRTDVALPKLRWYVSQQSPTDDESVSKIEVTKDFETLFGADEDVVHIKVFDMPRQEKQLVIDAKGIVWLGQQVANRVGN